MTDVEVPTTDIETRGAGAAQAVANAGELTTLTKAELVAWLKGEDISEDDNTDEIAYDQALKILSAENPEAALAPDDVRDSRSLIGKTFTVRSVSWRKSTKSEDGAGRYGFMSCVDVDGVPFYTSCGATKVVLKLRKFQLAGWLPATFTMAAIDTNTGRTMFDLETPQGDF